MIEEKIESIDELLCFVKTLYEQHGLRLWYRGVENSSWELLPSIQRSQQRINCERYLTNDFYIRTKQVLNNCPDKKNYAAWMSLMQHYGLPTRLLDWSHSPLIAVFFATETYMKTNQVDACVWVLAPGKLNEKEGFGDCIYPIDADTIQEMLLPAFKERGHNPELSNKIIACHSTENNLRMYSQQANFTIHNSLRGAGNLWAQNREMLNKYRGDLNEGLSTNTNVNHTNSINRAINFFHDIGGIPRDANAIGEIDSRFLSENVYCLSALFYDSENGELLKLNEKMFQFTDNTQGLAIVIYDVEKFLYRIIQTLSESIGSPYWIAYDLVDYDFNEYSNGEIDEFTKEQVFSYQQEFRIAINILEDNIRIRQKTNSLTYYSDRGTLSINIGSIRDIAFVLPVEDYINLKFPNCYQWVKTTQPSRICTFYPPVKNEISYICPLIRVDNIILISENALYPVMRDVNAFSINLKRLEKTLKSNPAKDSFFMSVLELYFSRLLDIYKSKKDKFLLDQILTAILNYMLALNIFHCAGIHLKIGNGVLSASYDDICLHDIGLINETCYEIIKKSLLQPKPSDFAVLVSLSNQTRFEEYEYEGKKYVRVEVARNGVLPSGKTVKAGEAIWVEVSELNFIGY